MKKFTKNFLKGGYRSALRIFRSIALGLIALTWAHTAALAQTCPPPDSTVYFIVDDLDACYNVANTYKVNVSVMDFWNVDQLNLFLDYDEVYWTFKEAKVLNDVFKSTASGPNGTNKPMTITDDGSILNFQWTEWVTRGQIAASMGTEVPIVELTFELKNFPNNSLPSYVNKLVWTNSSKIYHCSGSTNFTEFNDVDYTDGMITTNIAFGDVVLDIVPDTLDCSSDMADVTVTSPVGEDYKYSFNGGTTWQTSPKATAVAGTHAVRVQDANGCLSVKKFFTIESKGELTFKTTAADESCDNLGEIVIDIFSGGTAPITYWVVPDADYQAYINNGTPIDPKYSSDVTNRFLKAAGIYWSAVEDKCGVVGWVRDSIAPGAQFTYTLNVDVDTVLCYNASDGQVTISALTGGYPWADGYSVMIPGAVDTMFAGGDLVLSGLPVGTHDIIIADSICSRVETVTIYNTTPITFYVDYTDAPCTAGTGTMWINEINGEDIALVDPDIYAGWTWRVKGGGLDTIVASVTDTLKGISANYYSAWLIPGCPGEVPFDNTDGSGNTIPVLDDGSITFNTIVTNETCFEECDGTIKVTDVTRTCANCNEGAVYEFRVDGGAWMAIADTAMNLCPDTLLVEVRDAADPDVCIVSKEVIIVGAVTPLTVVVDTAYAPTCPGGNDGWVKMYVSGGTKPYEYSVDNAPNWRPAPSFGLTEGGHLLQVRDANGCTWSDSITVDSITPIMITAMLVDTVQCTGDKPSIVVTLDSYSYYPDITDYTWHANGEKFDIDSLGQSKKGFAPGMYQIYAVDPNGCESNLDTVVIDDVIPMMVYDPIVEDAECYQTWSGSITLTVSGGNPDSVYYYALANNPDVFNNPNANINWVPFTVGDTTEVIEVQKGTYWIQIQDACEKSTPVEAVVDGYDPIEIAKVDVENVKCNEDLNGTITVSDVTGGGPGYGIGKYLYTLRQLSDAETVQPPTKLVPIYTAVDTIVGNAMQESNMWTGLAAGEYRVYVYDDTDPMADPAMCPPDSMDVVILQPAELMFDVDVKHVSCENAENGELHLNIMGGTGGTWTINGQALKISDGKAYEVTINQIKGEYNYSLKLKDNQDTVSFQVMGGEFELVVTDANGCSAIDTVTVIEPKQWVITPITEDPSDCNIKDGKVWAVVQGGLDTMDIPGVEITVSLNGVVSGNVTMGDTILLSDTAVYDVDYIISVVNDYATIPQGIEFADSLCVENEKVTIEVFNPFEFDVAVQCVKCYGEGNGSVTISDITGGAGAYQIQLVGGDNPSYNPTDETLWWPKDEEGENKWITETTIDTLIAGDYWIYLRDSSGFTLANCCRPIKFTMCQPDSLELITVTLEENVACAGDSTGAISIQAMGGEAPYMYAYSRTDLGSDGFPYPSAPDPSEFVYKDSIITGLPTGLYIGWVMDANGCVTGCEIDAQGFPIDEHRVAIREAAAIAVDSVYINEPLCYGGLANVELWGVSGGSGDSMTIVLSGKTYNGMDTTYFFGPLATGLGNYILEDVYGSDDNGYVISIATDANCAGGGDTIWVTQPPVFAVSADIISGAVCEGDDEVLISISTTGGTAPFKYDIYKDGTKIRSNSQIVNHVVEVGYEYVVVAKDALGCNMSDTLMIETPQPIMFSIRDVSCYGEAKASARIEASGTPGRSFRVLYKEIEGDLGPSDWTQYNGWFTETIDIVEEFTFDDDNIKDVHYEFIVEDDQGCRSELGVMTFDKVQHPIEMFVDESNITECTADLLLNVTGGIEPYVVTIDGDTITNMQVTLGRGIHEIIVNDSHLRCQLVTPYDVVTDMVMRDTTINTYIGEEVQFIDDIAGLDTMLTVGVYDFMYTDSTSMCERGLTVTVVEVPREYSIKDVQGDGDTSPVEGGIAKIMGTVTGVASGEGFFVQDASEAWSGIWVEYTDVDVDGITVGTAVSVVGEVAEVANVTTILATEVMMEGTAIEVVPVEVAPSDAEAEMYESVVVKVHGARATAADEGTGQWRIYYEPTDDIIVNDWLYSFTPVDSMFYDVTGIVNGRLDAFKLEPRMEDDVVASPTAVDPTFANAFKVYPNPFNDKIYIDNNDKLTRVVITNIAGQRVIDIEYPEREIRTANLVSGVYLVNLFTESGLAKTDRIVKR